MEVRIGITHLARELSFETDQSADEVRGVLEQAIKADEVLVSFSDTKGRQYLVDTGSIAFVELGSDVNRRVGFVS